LAINTAVLVRSLAATGSDHRRFVNRATETERLVELATADIERAAVAHLDPG